MSTRKNQQLRSDLAYINQICTSNTYEISRNFVIFRDTKFREMKKLFREMRKKYFAKEKFRRPPYTEHMFETGDFQMGKRVCDHLFRPNLPLHGLILTTISGHCPFKTKFQWQWAKNYWGSSDIRDLSIILKYLVDDMTKLF
jgi:hypothetical protein